MDRQCLERKLVRNDLVAVAHRICYNDWRNYGRKLGIAETDIESIAQKNVEEQRFQLLYKWYKGQKNPTFQDLIEAASAENLEQLAEEIKELATETSCSDGVEPASVPPEMRNRSLSRERKHGGVQTRQSSTSQERDSSEPILRIYNAWHKRVMLDGHPHFRKALLVTLSVIFVIQFALTIAHVYFLNGSEYHGDYNGLLASSLVTLLRLLTRCGLPLILLIVTIDVIWTRANETVPIPQKDFRRQIQDEKHESVLRKVIHQFWNKTLASKEPLNCILQKIQRHFETALTSMLVASLLEAIVLTLTLWKLEAASYYPTLYEMEYHGAVVLRALDIVTFFVLNFSSGVMFAFFFHEITVKHLIAAVVKVNDYSDTELPKDLKHAAKKALDCIVSGWTILELFLYIGVQAYSFILVACAVAQIPLSYGVLGDMHHTSWLIFVVASTALHFLSTSPYLIPYIRGIGIVLEVLGLFWLFFFDIPKFGGFLQTMYVTVPGAYLFWYLVAMVHHERIVLGQKPRDSRVKHCRRFGRNLAFLLLWTSVLVLSIICEYLLLRSRANGSQPAFGSEVPLHVNNADTFSRTVQIGSHFIQETCVCYGNSTSSPCSCLSYRGP